MVLELSAVLIVNQDGYYSLISLPVFHTFARLTFDFGEDERLIVQINVRRRVSKSTLDEWGISNDRDS